MLSGCRFVCNYFVKGHFERGEYKERWQKRAGDSRGASVADRSQAQQSQKGAGCMPLPSTLRTRSEQGFVIDSSGLASRLDDLAD